MATPSGSDDSNVPVLVLCFIGWLLFLAGFLLGLAANSSGLTVHLR
jgi:hypothetical protein